MAKKKRKPRVISIRWIVSGAAVLLMSVTVLGVGGVAERNARQALSGELEARLRLQARNLALASSGALLSEFPELTLTPILAEIRANQPEHAFAVVVDLDGGIRGHADARMIGERFELPGDLVPVRGTEVDPSYEQVLASPELLVSVAPVAHPGGDRIGTAYVALYRSYIDGLIADARRKQAILLLVLLVVGIVAALVFMSVLLRPVGALREGLERIGRGDLETPVRLKDRTELGLLAETMNEMSTRIKEAQAERVEKERLSREVELAREIQSSLLPSGDMKVKDCVIDGAQKAAAEVGGDYYDVFPLTEGRVGVAIADVSGKGLAGCLVTSMLSVLLRAFRDTEASPSRLLVRLDERLRDSLRPGTFITMFYGILDPETWSFTFASAGHSPLLVHRAASSKTEWYKTRGIPLGALRNGAITKTLKDERIELGPGDVVVQYTDGINEAFDLTGEEQFGFRRLEEVTARHAPKGCRAVVDAIRNAVAQWAGDQPPLDDETLVVLGLGGGPAQGNGGAPSATEAAPDPVGVLEKVRRTGRRLRLTADLDGLTGIREWLDECQLPDFDPREVTLLESALYEVCANIVEHGYAQDAEKSFELWYAGRTTDGSYGRDSEDRYGLFVVVDQGVPFRPPESRVSDIDKAMVRRRRRGLGLTIIHQAMNQVSYHPGTPAGNITILGFDPAKIRVEEGATNG